VFDYGFNVETAGDDPVWHRFERDRLPADEHAGREAASADLTAESPEPTEVAR
jgi:hypothetical protein